MSTKKVSQKDAVAMIKEAAAKQKTQAARLRHNKVHHLTLVKYIYTLVFLAMVVWCQSQP